ncbi:MAG TPA: inorganic diphosphatase [Candidatus Baltobacteraceae bacterium]|nr:inorganic diphosphatase [Candidatus Baltobacteraceae bacterium]
MKPFPGDPQKDYLVHVIVETPRGVRHKYAFDEESGYFTLRATIPEGLTWPYDYGFVPQTKGGDGDPIDALYMNDEPTFPGCLAKARLLGIIRLQKNGEQNDRLLTCAQRVEGIAQSTDVYDDIADVPKAVIDSMCRFLSDYSEEAGNRIEVRGVEGRERALEAVRAAASRA